MFGILSRGIKVYAPVNGYSLDLKDVSDPVFSSKLIGDGIAVYPVSGSICSPVDGRIALIMESGHAFAINARNGAQILVHIGINTVNLKGEGFRILSETNRNVRIGEPILEFDLDKIKKLGYDPTVMIIVSNDGKYALKGGIAGHEIKAGVTSVFKIVGA